MPSTMTRRPLPALVSLLALLLLTALVWWRVLHRSSADGAANACSTPKPPAPTVSATATLPPPAQVTVEVLNSTNRSGIAAKARTTLTGAGFNIPQPAHNDSPNVHVTGVGQIRYGTPGAAGAQLLSYYLPGAQLVHTTSKTATVVVSLGERYREVATAGAVATEMRTHRVTVATTSPSPTPTASVSPSC